jgi:hypothetical protein
MKLNIRNSGDFRFMFSPSYSLITQGSTTEIPKDRWCEMIMVYTR